MASNNSENPALATSPSSPQSPTLSAKDTAAPQSQPASSISITPASSNTSTSSTPAQQGAPPTTPPSSSPTPSSTQQSQAPLSPPQPASPLPPTLPSTPVVAQRAPLQVQTPPPRPHTPVQSQTSTQTPASTQSQAPAQSQTSAVTQAPTSQASAQPQTSTTPTQSQTPTPSQTTAPQPPPSSPQPTNVQSPKPSPQLPSSLPSLTPPRSVQSLPSLQSQLPTQVTQSLSHQHIPQQPSPSPQSTSSSQAQTSQPMHPPVQLTPIQSHPLHQPGASPQRPPSPLHPHSHLSHTQLHAQQGPIQPTPQTSQSTAGSAPPSPILPSLQSIPAPPQAPPLPPSSQSIPPTLPAAPIQPIQSIQPIPISMQHQVNTHQLPHIHALQQQQLHQQQHLQQQTPPPLSSPQGGSSRVNPPSPYNAHPVAPAHQKIKFENALEFLDQVKLQFSKQPRVYNQFLDIMKDFKAQYIDTPGVISRVSELFKGHKHLILGFNTFLPPGYKIEIPDDDKPPLITQPSPHPPLVAVPVQPSAPAPPTGGRKQPEFDHARSYVKKIKTRFQLQPTVYKSFLDILHAYHKEQHTIKDVYDQVATLFASHADLLEEFKQFLPDPVASNNAQAPIPQPTSPTPQPPRVERKGNKRNPKKPQPPSPEKDKPERKKRQLRREEMPSKRAAYEDHYEGRYGVPSPINTPKEEDNNSKFIPEGSFEELDFFNRVKGALENPKLYHEFLKCLNLYSQEIISRVELVLLVKDLLSRYPDLFDWFKHFIGFDEASMELLEKKEAMALEDNRQPWSEIDFSTCKRYGPSYRALPANYGTPRCSGRTELCWSTLNDLWVSVPTGSEDFTFKNQRKNQYEEVLFKCEDERYELDLVMELNASAIRALEPIKAKLVGLTEEEAGTFKMEALDPLHARSIERIYGDKGVEILEGIYANPAVAVPIVLQRLKQKDSEWHKSKQEWDKVWREITAKNYHKSLDHQSFFFKQAEKKALSPKVLIAEIKQQFADKLREQQEEGKEGKRARKKEVVPWHLQYSLTDPRVFKDISELILFSAEKLLSRADKEKIDTFLKHFLNIFLRVEDIYKQPTPPASPPQSPPHANSVPSSSVPATASNSVPPTTPPPSTPPVSLADKDKEKERDKLPTTPPTPNLNNEVKTENDGEKKDSIMEDAHPDESVSAPTTAPISSASTSATSDASAPSNSASAPSEPATLGETKPEEGKEKEGEKEKDVVMKDKEEEEKVRRIRKIFFGNSTFYVFFRLYQIMYSRLSQGKELAQASRKAKWNSRPTLRAKANGEAGLGSPESTEGGKTVEKEKEKDEAQEKDRYQTYLEQLYSLLAGAVDLSHYEDECRSLLGISSYVLFTMDKLVVQITRQLQALLSSEPCAKLLSLFMYETVRPQGMQESVYHASCTELLREERMFLFEFEQVPNPGRFTIQLLDATNQPLPRFVEFNFEPSKYSEYVAAFQRESSKIDPRKHHVFQIRNLKHNRDDPTVLRGVVNTNNLECRICLSTYRLFYVEDTEDFFYRPSACRANRNEKQTPDRKINYTKLGIAPPSEDTVMKTI